MDGYDGRSQGAQGRKIPRTEKDVSARQASQPREAILLIENSGHSVPARNRTGEAAGSGQADEFASNGPIDYEEEIQPLNLVELCQ